MTHITPQNERHDCATPLERLKRLHMVDCVPYRQISSQGLFEGIPCGTLSYIVRTGKVPSKWHKRFGIVVMQPAPVCPIHNVVHVSKTCPVAKKPATRWADMPVSQVRWAIDNREVME
jgi:hypothetical protein